MAMNSAFWGEKLMIMSTTSTMTGTTKSISLPKALWNWGIMSLLTFSSPSLRALMYTLMAMPR